MGAKFAILTFNGYNNGNGYSPARHNFEVTVFVTPATQIRLYRKTDYAVDSTKSDTYNGVSVSVNGTSYDIADNYNTAMDKIASALAEVL